MPKFNVGDKIRVNMTLAEDCFEGCKGTTVYNTMIEKARKHRFEVLDNNNGFYLLKRDDGQAISESADEVESYFELDSGG
jgi:hypothetical protein